MNVESTFIWRVTHDESRPMRLCRLVNEVGPPTADMILEWLVVELADGAPGSPIYFLATDAEINNEEL